MNCRTRARSKSVACRGGTAKAACLLIALGASAQDPVAPWLRYNVGKVVILPKVDLVNSFTDNLFNLSGANRVADGITAVTPGLKLKWDENAAVDASVEYRHGEVLIWENSGFNSSSDTVDAKVGYTAAKWKATGSTSFSESVALQRGVLNLGRNLLRTSLISGSAVATYDWTAKSDVTAALNYRNTDYDSRFLIDQEQLDGRLGFSHDLTRRLRWTADVRSGHTAARSNGRIDSTADSFFYGALAGLRGSFTQKLSGAMRVGYEVRQFDGGESFSAATPAVGLDVAYQASVLTRVTLAYDRTTGVGAWQGGQVTIQDSLSLRVIHALGITGRWLVTGNGRVGFGDYEFDPSLFPAGTPDFSRTDSSYGVDLAVQYRPQAWLTCSAGYSFDKYDISFPDPFASFFIAATSYHSHRVFVSVTVGF